MSVPNIKKTICYLLLPGLFLLVFSCTAANYGKLQFSHEITEVFDNDQVLSDYVYYYSGLEGVPDAIIGIHKDYSLRSKMWRRIDLSPATLNKWVSRMSYIQQVAPRGAWILAPGGNRIGFWFSAQNQTSVRMEGDNRVVVAPAEPPELRGVP
jgi:hypothetical protein